MRERLGSLLHKNKRRLGDILFALGLLAAAALFIRGFYKGVIWEDEAFYPTIAYRLVKGDSLVVDEWHLSQFSSFFLYIPVKLFYTIKGSMDGWILFARCLFLPIHLATAAALYCKLRRYGLFAIPAALLYALHVPMGICTLSYNSLCVTFLTLACILLLWQYEKPHMGKLYAIGVLFACCTVCNPLFALVYVAFCAAALFWALRESEAYSAYQKERRKKKKGKPKRGMRLHEPTREFLNKRAWLVLTLGVGTVAVAAVVFFFGTGGTLRGLAANIPNLFTDSQHNYFGEDGVGYSNNLLQTWNDYYLLCKPLWFLMPLALLAAAVRRRFFKKIPRVLILAAGTGITILYCFLIHVSNNLFLWMLPLAFFGLLCCLLTEKINRTALVFFWIPGNIYAVIQLFSSDMTLFGMCFGLSVSNIGCVWFASALIRELLSAHTAKPKRALAWLAVLLVTLGVAAQGGFQFGADHSIYLTHGANTVPDGPYTGVRVDKKFSVDYKLTLEDLQTLEDKCDEDDCILLAVLQPWMYLCIDRTPASYSAWLLPLDVERLQHYYEVNPSHAPDYIYVGALGYPHYTLNIPGTEKAAEAWCEIFNCTMEKAQRGYILTVKK